MKIALNQIEGLMKDKKITQYEKSVYQAYKADGFNEAIDLQGSRRIEVRLDREKLADLIILYILNGKIDRIKELNYNQFLLMSDAIIAKESEIIKVTYKEEK